MQTDRDPHTDNRAQTCMWSCLMDQINGGKDDG